MFKIKSSMKMQKKKEKRIGISASPHPESNAAKS